MDSLCDDALIIICEYLTQKDIMMISMVNKKLYSFVVLNPRIFWYKHNYMINMDNKNKGQWYEFIKNSTYKCVDCDNDIIYMLYDHQIVTNYRSRYVDCRLIS